VASQGDHSDVMAGHCNAHARHGVDGGVQVVVYDATAEGGGDAAAGRVEVVAQAAGVGVGKHDSALYVAAAAVPDEGTGDHSALEGRNDADSSRSDLDSLEAEPNLGDHRNGDGTERGALHGCTRTVEVAHRDSGGGSSATVHHSDVVLGEPHIALGEGLRAQSAGSWADTAAPTAYLKASIRATHDENHEPSWSQKLQRGEAEPLMVAPPHVCYFGSC
jgi:hypothetical protein